ncbi:rCG57445 [Rattus norvegicus]|uniref:RCG57445 n=1 Tax=Rattus norvegicus TaxID=10116 RepID=A6JI73_RAT|nr:rCG57445 [Rattus norvegicus]
MVRVHHGRAVATPTNWGPSVRLPETENISKHRTHCVCSSYSCVFRLQF